MVFKNLTPVPFTISSMDISGASSPIPSTGIPGLGWPPVIAVVLLSRITSTNLSLLCTAFRSGAIPAWKKVESPMKLTIFWFVAFEKPQLVPTLDPIDRR